MNVIETILAIVFLSSTCPQGEGWKGIVPLHATRLDVERVLGPPAGSCNSLCKYESKKEVVFVRYSAEPCGHGEESRWRVPPDTVIDLTVNLEETPKLSDLKLDLRKFKKTRDPELHGYYTYKNEDEGVVYAVSAEGRVYSIDWFATTKDDKALRCSSAPISTDSGRNPIFNLTGAGLTLEQDKPRLDQFAKNLKAVPDSKAYIIAYGRDLGLAGEARMRLKCVGGYLKKVHHISSSRLVMIDGGYASEMNVELFLVRPGDPKPKSAPSRSLTAVRNIKPRTDPCR